LTIDKRKERQIDKHRENEARWLQKVLFDLNKARDAREKLAETSGEELNPLITLEDGSKVPLDTLEEIIDQRVTQLMDALGKSVYGRRK
jgi:hypothetical protein